MKIIDVRLTLYALLSSIESDMRRLIRLYVLPHKSGLNFILDKSLRERVVDRYKREHPERKPETDSADVLEYFDFGDTYQVLRQNSDVVPDKISQELKKCAQEFADLANIRNRVFHSRPLIAGDFQKVYGFVSDIASASGIEWPATISMFTRLAGDPSCVLEFSIPSFASRETVIFNNLPAPEFDDTGFVGRTDDAHEVKKLLLGPHTVVSIIGEGGVGKTALMLKVAYDLLEMGESCPFQAILWSSAKTTVLTATGIENIRNALSDAPAIAHDIASAVGAQSTDMKGHLEEIISFMQEIKTLLVLDNVETILNEEIREFLKEALQYGKIAITSRVGLGELEYRWPLQPMKKREAEALFREHARIRNMPDLQKMKQGRLDNILDQLHYNPLAIKWFVTSVQSGKTIDEVIAAKDDLLQYCMSNVFSQLDESGQHILQVALAARRHTSEAELIYYTEKSAIEVRKAINQLLATSFMTRVSRKKGSAEETVYVVNDFAKTYLLKQHAPPKRMVEDVQKKRNHLWGSVESGKRIARADEFAINALEPTNPSEKAVCPKLEEALALSRHGSFAEALMRVDEAKAILAEYFEVYRVSAFIKSMNEDLIGAENDYKLALDLASENPRLLYFFAGFLALQMNDPAAALPYAEKAYALRPESLDTAILLARCSGYSGDLERALEMLNYLSDSETVGTGKHRRVITTLLMDFYRRKAEESRMIRKDYLEAIKSAQTGLNVFDGAVRAGVVDDRIIKALVKLFDEYASAIEHVDNEGDRNIYLMTLRQHQDFIAQGNRRDLLSLLPQETAYPEVRESLGYRDGTVIERYDNRLYAFIEAPNGERYFFHRNEIAQHEEWDALKAGITVRFRVGEDSKGQIAVDVSRAKGIHRLSTNQHEGRIVEYYADRPFAFIETGSGIRRFFHRTALLKNTRWDDLENGVPVVFRDGENDQGVCAVDVEVVSEVAMPGYRAPRLFGRIVEYYSDRPFAFIQCATGKRFYFHREATMRGNDFRRLRNGTYVMFDVGANKQGECAAKVELYNLSTGH